MIFLLRFWQNKMFELHHFHLQFVARNLYGGVDGVLLLLLLRLLLADTFILDFCSFFSSNSYYDEKRSVSFKLNNLTRNENTRKILQVDNNNNDKSVSFCISTRSVRIWKAMEAKPTHNWKATFSHRRPSLWWWYFLFLSSVLVTKRVYNVMRWADKRANEQMYKIKESSRKTYF